MVGVHDATADLVETADILVVGGPTHVHGLSSNRSRRSAKQIASKDHELHLEPDAEGPGLRDWFDALADVPRGRAAAFDTRVHATMALTGHASKGIATRLRRLGFEMLAEPESFFVDRSNRLETDETERAEAWGRSVAQSAVRAHADA